MSDDKKDLATLDAAILRVKDELKRNDLGPDIRAKLEEELRILGEIRYKIAEKADRPVPN